MLQLSRACGITGHDIMFSSNVTPNEDFKLASDLDAIVNFDDITHLDYYDKVLTGSARSTIPRSTRIIMAVAVIGLLME